MPTLKRERVTYTLASGHRHTCNVEYDSTGDAKQDAETIRAVVAGEHDVPPEDVRLSTDASPEPEEEQPPADAAAEPEPKADAPTEAAAPVEAVAEPAKPPLIASDEPEPDPPAADATIPQ